ncbi:uncharacterized protein G2W53_008989 [Senna tora]|uniref:Uncharacterized protein n=1 Tax=Senna tora TaxID=362788 RepID=A0A834WXH9_9FABA|nr:uncharacterized protein G2W53_008989 [Senna tora]
MVPFRTQDGACTTTPLQPPRI